MRIVSDISVLELPLTGVGKAAVFLYEACLSIQNNLEITAIHRRALRTPLDPRISDARVGRFLPPGVWREVYLSFAIQRAKPSWVHFPWSGNVPRLPGNLKVVSTLHDVLPLIIPGYFRNDEQETHYRERIQRDITRTHLLLTDSEFSKKQIMTNFKLRTEPVVLLLAPTLKHNGRDFQRTDSDPYFIYVGGYDRRKGLEYLLKVFCNLVGQKQMDHRLVVVGDKRYLSDECDGYLLKLRSWNKLEETGYLADSELAERLQGATALVYPSRFEGFGLPPLEAMSVGCPVLTTRETSLPEVCGDAALYVDPRNEEQFAEQLLRLASDQSLRDHLKHLGFEQARRFTWENSASQFLSHLEKAA